MDKRLNMVPLMEEETNWNRACRLLTEAGTELLILFLKDFWPRAGCESLDNFLVANRKTLDKVAAKGILHDRQMDIIYPESGFTDTNLWDITLVYCILRNCIPNKSPLENAAINNIRDLRNRIHHDGNMKMAEDEYMKNWTDIQQCLSVAARDLRVNQHFLQTLQARVDRIEKEQIVDGEKLRNTLQAWTTSDVALHDVIEQIGAEQRSCHTDIQTVLSEVRDIKTMMTEDNSRSVKRTKLGDSGRDTCTLKQVLEKPGEITVIDHVSVKILKTETPVNYKSKTRQNTLMKLLLADTTAFTPALAFHEAKYHLLVEGECVIMSDVIKKEDGTLILTSKSSVYAASPTHINVPDTIVTKALANKTQLLSVIDASSSPNNTVLTVKGKVVKTSMPTSKRLSDGNEEVPFKKIKLKDKSGSIEVHLWRNLAESPVKVGDRVQLDNFYKSTSHHKEKHSQIAILSNQRDGSSIQFTNDDHDSVSSDASDFEEADRVGKLVGIEYVKNYKCCPNTRCKRKKLLDDLSCCNCNVKYTEASCDRGFVAKVLVEEDDGLSNITCFTECMETLLESLKISEKTDVLTEIKSLLPIEIKYQKYDDKFAKLSSVIK